MYKYIVSGLTLASLLSLTPAFAGDCTTNFTQECLATRYNRRQVEHDAGARMSDITSTGMQQAATARAEEARQEEAARFRAYREDLRILEASREKRHQELMGKLDELEKEREERKALSGRSRRVYY